MRRRIGAGQCQQHLAGLGQVAGLGLAGQHHRVKRAGQRQAGKAGAGCLDSRCGLRGARRSQHHFSPQWLLCLGLRAGRCQCACGHVKRAAGVVGFLLRIKALRHQFGGAAVFSLCGGVVGLGLRQRGIGHRGTHGLQLRLPGVCLYQGGFCLGQGGSGLGVA
jgi:hypothetical protein